MTDWQPSIRGGREEPPNKALGFLLVLGLFALPAAAAYFIFGKGNAVETPSGARDFVPARAARTSAPRPQVLPRVDLKAAKTFESNSLPRLSGEDKIAPVAGDERENLPGRVSEGSKEAERGLRSGASRVGRRATGGAGTTAAKKSKKTKKYRQPDLEPDLGSESGEVFVRTNFTHSHGGGVPHHHGANGAAADGHGHSKAGKKLSLEEILAHSDIKGVNLKKLAEIGRRLHDAQMAGGAEPLTEDKARETVRELGLDPGFSK